MDHILLTPSSSCLTTVTNTARELRRSPLRARPSPGFIFPSPDSRRRATRDTDQSSGNVPSSTPSNLNTPTSGPSLSESQTNKKRKQSSTSTNQAKKKKTLTLQVDSLPLNLIKYVISSDLRSIQSPMWSMWTKIRLLKMRLRPTKVRQQEQEGSSYSFHITDHQSIRRAKWVFCYIKSQSVCD